jgi:hypothetical protein
VGRRHGETRGEEREVGLGGWTGEGRVVRCWCAGRGVKTGALEDSRLHHGPAQVDRARQDAAGRRSAARAPSPLARILTSLALPSKPIRDAHAMPDRLIIALDLDNFYVGVERLITPALVGRPVGISQSALAPSPRSAAGGKTRRLTDSRAETLLKSRKVSSPHAAMRQGPGESGNLWASARLS